MPPGCCAARACKCLSADLVRRHGATLADAGRRDAVPAPGPGSRGRPSWTRTRCRTWCWRWTTRRACAVASSTIYKESGFPEIWVLVPWESSVRAPGLDDSRARRGAGISGGGVEPAFPGWKAEEIFRAADRGTDVRRRRGVRTGAHGAGDGSARGHEAGGRSAHALRTAQQVRTAESHAEGHRQGLRRGRKRDARVERAHGAEEARQALRWPGNASSRAPRRTVGRRRWRSGARRARTRPTSARRVREQRTGAGATVRVRRMEGTAHDVIGRGAGFRPFAIGGLTGGREAVLAQWQSGREHAPARPRRSGTRRRGRTPGGAFSRPDPRESRRLTGGTTIQPAPEPSRPFPRRRTSSTRASSSDGVSHSTRAPSTPSSTS